MEGFSSKEIDVKNDNNIKLKGKMTQKTNDFDSEIDFVKYELKNETLKLLESVSHSENDSVKPSNDNISSINNFEKLKDRDMMKTSIENHQTENKKFQSLRTRAKKNLKINLNILTNKEKDNSNDDKRISIKEKQEIFDIKKSELKKSKSYRNLKKKAKISEKTKNKSKLKIRSETNLNDHELTNDENPLKIKIKSLIGKFEKYKKKMNNLDQKREIKKIYRSQSSPLDHENVLTFGKKKKETVKNSKLEKNSKKEKFIGNSYNRKIINKMKKKVTKNKYISEYQPMWTDFKTRNTERKLNKIFSLYSNNTQKLTHDTTKTIKSSNKKKLKKKRNKVRLKTNTIPYVPKFMEKRRSLTNKKINEKQSSPYFSTKNIFGFNDYSEKTLSNDKNSHNSHSNLTNIIQTNKTINLGNLQWQEGSSGSNSNNRISEMNTIHPSEISETGSSIFIPRNKMKKKKKYVKIKQKLQSKNRTGDSSQFKTSFDLKNLNFKTSKSLRFLKTFKSLLSKK
jgi:hypothetical protein